MVVWAQKLPSTSIHHVARLMGAAQAVRETTHLSVNILEVWNDTCNRTLAAIRTELDQATFTAAWNEGQAMTLEQAMTYALDVCKNVGAQGRTPLHVSYEMNHNRALHISYENPLFALQFVIQNANELLGGTRARQQFAVDNERGRAADAQRSCFGVIALHLGLEPRLADALFVRIFVQPDCSGVAFETRTSCFLGGVPFFRLGEQLRVHFPVFAPVARAFRRFCR